MASMLNNCQLFYFVGEDTIANVTHFAMLMLALYPEWHDRARKGVLDVLGDGENNNPNAVLALTWYAKFSAPSLLS